MAAPPTVNVWADFEAVRTGVPYMTVDKLKHVLTGLHDDCNARLSKSGRKQDLVDRIQLYLSDLRNKNATVIWAAAKNVISQVRTGTYPSNRASTSSGPSYIPALPTASTSALRPGAVSALNRAPRPSAATPKTGITFKESPFLEIVEPVSPVHDCRESTSATDRRQETLSFTLTPDHVNKLKDESNYQLRLFCTSSTFHSTNAYRPNAQPCPIEFPPTCEVRVNNVQLTANLKGMKKKPGTAPPPNISQRVQMVAGLPNRIEMVYVNSQQPVASKKFFLVVMLVKVTSVDKLIARLTLTRRRTPQEIKTAMLASLRVDDDIVAGATKMSLKCPLSYVRVSTPCRSSKCVHSQCFDALSWYSVMEQTTTWLCPVCERVLDPQELIVDGFFEEIVRATPESEEEVIVEADGEWHTPDDKFASPVWRAGHPVKAPAPQPAPKAQTPVSATSQWPKADPLKKARMEVLVIDDSDDEDGGYKRQFNASQASGPAQSQSETVIDLTLDSDDDDPPPRAPSQANKRKASDADMGGEDGYQPFKKPRPEAERPGVQLHAYPNVGTSNAGFRTLAPLSATAYVGGRSSAPYR